MQKRIHKIVFLGAGNLATVLSKILSEKGYEVLQLWRRGDRLNTEADLYIVAVTDSAIDEVVQWIPETAFWVHTSANHSIDRDVKSRSGVFYPLQTFTKNIDVDFTEIPVLIESVNKDLESALLELGSSLSKTVYLSTEEQRRKLHVAAVFASNFTNHLYTISEQLLSENQLAFDLLKPLIKQTVRKIEQHSPNTVQTGPAVRGDKQVMKLQKTGLAKDHKKIYNLLSESIEKHYRDAQYYVRSAH